MSWIVKFIVILLSLAACVQAAELSVSQQQRAYNLYAQVRCPTCVAQSVKDSTTIASQQIRTFIDNQIIQGKTDEEILSQLQQYYGAGAVLKPSITIGTILLWIVPVGFLLSVLYMVCRTYILR